MNHRLLSYLSAFSVIALGGLQSPARADVRLADVIGSHMVLQRDQPLPIWGTADPGEAVAVRLDGGAASATKADAQGHWKVVLPAVKADGKTHRATVSGRNKIELDDILIGEVWIGAGQSNMGCPYNAPAAIAAANCPQVRLLNLSVAKSAAWEISTRDKLARGFSGPLCYFGLRLQKELGLPVGLIHAAVGGSAVELWTTVPGGQSGRFYKELISPLVPFAIRGTVWYQGEANNQDGLRYAPKMKALIEGWRQAWGREFPFYFVQIAPFGYDPYTDLKFLWEAQAEALKVPRTGIVVTTDLVEDLDEIHAVNKFEVGNRLALWALAKDYGRKDLIYSGPLYKGMKIEGRKIRIFFAHAAGLKSRDGQPLTHFEIAGPDGNFADAEATIDGQTVLVSAKEVPAPTQVWFGWHNIVNPNLVNQAGLPALPFQTKTWRGGTAE
jgi:sialate O-acetylesterase